MFCLFIYTVFMEDIQGIVIMCIYMHIYIMFIYIYCVYGRCTRHHYSVYMHHISCLFIYTVFMEYIQGIIIMLFTCITILCLCIYTVFS